MNSDMRGFGIFLVVSMSLAALAMAVEPPPLINWSAPATYVPLRDSKIRALGDISSPVPFIAVTPCRQYDSRLATALADNTPRTIPLIGAPCGIPSSVRAISINITVFNITGATGNGVFRVGIVSPPPTAWINYPSYETQRANAGVVATDGSGQIVLLVNQGGGQVDFTLDVNGYYYDHGAGSGLLNSGEQFAIEGSINNNGIFFGLNDSTGAGADGGVFATASGASNSAGVVGQALSASGKASGVWGMTLSVSLDTAGVKGSAGSPTLGSLNFGRAGVRGEASSGSGIGLLGLSTFLGADGFLLDGSGNILASGILGSSLNSRTSGVLGFLSTGAGDTAGVLGINGTGSPVPLPTGFSTAGVRGEGDLGTGVLGISRSNGVIGVMTDSMGAIRATGYLGTLVGGFFTAVYAAGDLEVTGVKNFVEPHPTDASKVIVYSALESREVGTYFRGTARVEGGRAVIELPEDFRIVTDEEGLTVQLTPIRSFASMYVESEDLNQIVVRSSKDVTFHYLVQGVRRAFKDFKPVRNGEEFMPPSAASRMPGYLTEEARQRLITNGTYNPDGTVNLETAERAGWTRIWREREEQVKAASVRAAAGQGHE